MVEKGWYSHGVSFFKLAIEKSISESGGGDNSVLDSTLRNVAAGLGAMGGAEGMAVGYLASLSGGGGGDPRQNLATVVKLVTHVPPIVGGGLEDIEEFRRGWLEGVERLRQVLAGERAAEWWFEAAKVQDPVYMVGQTLFHLAHQGGDDVEFMRGLSALYDNARKGADSSMAWRGKRGEGDKIRVAFVSTLLFDHSIGKMMAQVMSSLNRAHGDRFSVIAVGPKHPDFVPGQAGPSLPELGAASSDVVVQFTCESIAESRTLPRNEEDAAAVLRSISADVVVFTDIGMDALTFFLAQSRYAPVQAAWWGHPTTTGMPTVDYYLGLDVELPDANSQYTEQLVRFEHMSTAPYAPSPDGPRRRRDRRRCCKLMEEVSNLPVSYKESQQRK